MCKKFSVLLEEALTLNAEIKTTEARSKMEEAKGLKQS